MESAGLQPGAEVGPGALLGVHLVWSGPRAPLSPGVKITLQLLDERGALVTQTDAPLVIETGRSSHGVRLPASLRPGAYRLIAALYDADAPDMPRLLTESGHDAVVLAEVRIH